MESFLASHLEIRRLISVAIIVFCGGTGIAVATCAFYGWGRLARRLAGLQDGAWPLSTALGLAAILFIGGLLNLARFAYPTVLTALVLGGLALAALAIRKDRVLPRPPASRRGWYVVLPLAAAVVALTGFTITTQLAPLLYNPDDDFKEYFAHAVRMVETGTLYGSPVNALGGETLGGQAFLHGFIVGHFPLAYINGADAVFCFFLCLALAAGVAIGRPGVGLPSLVGTLAVFAINPQYVNVSSLFSTAAMISALMIVSVDRREGGKDAVPLWRTALAPALFYAGAIALKHTSIVFLGLHLAFAAIAASWAIRNWRAGLASAVWVVIWSVAFLSPWLLLYAPYFATALTRPLGLPSTPVPDGGGGVPLLSLFSSAETLYGGSRLAYTGLASGLILAALCSVMLARTKSNRQSLAALASASAAAGASYLFWTIAGPYLQESMTTLRYAIPVLIGAVSVALPLLAANIARPRAMFLSAASAALLLLFMPSLAQRMETLRNHGAALAYLNDRPPMPMERERGFQHAVLHGKITAHVQRFQALIPPDEPFLAWTTFPFLLDYRRNQVVDANVAGLSQAWGRIPRVRYILWQHDGYATSTVAQYQRDIVVVRRRTGFQGARAIDVLQWLREMAPTSKILRDDDGIIAFEMNEDTPSID